MGARLNSLISNYYEKRGGEELNEADALTVMKALEKEIVNEVINEHAEEVAEREAAEHESLMRKERDERFRVAMKSFTRLILEAVVLSTIVGLIGSHLYGIGEAMLYAPNEDFGFLASLVVLTVLFVLCVALIQYVFSSSLPDWVADAARRKNGE